ncbi:hypothetical protein C5167_029385 [Papaver somniferum]|nr:hypothetical protein C5167_029385 [Papaver somniferum]
MAQIHKLHVQNELKNCSADQFYSFIKNEATKFPRVCPHIIKSFQILAGNGSIGTVRVMKIAAGASHEVTVKDKIVAADDESRTLSITIIDGDLLRMYPKFEYTLTVTPVVTQRREQSSLLKLSVEYEKGNEDVPAPLEYTELATALYKAIAGHLAKNA